MQLTLSVAFAVFTCALPSVFANSFDAGSHIGRNVHVARDYEFANIAAAYEAGMEDPRLNERVGKWSAFVSSVRPSLTKPQSKSVLTQTPSMSNSYSDQGQLQTHPPYSRRSLAKIGIFDAQTGENNGYLYVFGNYMRNTTTQPSIFQYTKPANINDTFDLEFPIQVRTSDIADRGHHRSLGHFPCYSREAQRPNNLSLPPWVWRLKASTHPPSQRMSRGTSFT